MRRHKIAGATIFEDISLSHQEGRSRDGAFIEYYENNHLPLICDLAPTPIIYKRNFLMRGYEFNKEDNAIDFDVVTELVFPDRAAYLAWAAQLSKAGSGEQVVADELKFLGRSQTRPMSSRNA